MARAQRPAASSARTASAAEPRLSFDALVDAATQMAVDEGVEAVSMRRLADRCGVGVMTLYGYVQTKEELLGAVGDRFLREIVMPRPEDPWREQVAALFDSVREVMLAHPALVPILAGQRIDGVAAYRGAELVLGALRERGVSDADAVSAFTTLTSFTVGYVQREVAAARSPALGALRGLSRAEFPHVVALADVLEGREATREFQTGLRLIVDGIAMRVAA